MAFPAKIRAQTQVLTQRILIYGFAVPDGEVAGAALLAGRTPAPEFEVAEEAGDNEVCGLAAAGEPGGAGEVCGAPCVFISSRRKALLAVPWCAYRTDNANVSTKKNPASHVVNFTSTLVV